LDEEKRLNMDISEYKKLLKAASEGKTAASENGSDGEQHERPISSLVKNALGVTDKSKFKRNKAKVIFSPCLVPNFSPQIPLYKKKIPRHIEMSAHV
jgi:hypothetical protein